MGNAGAKWLALPLFLLLSISLSFAQCPGCAFSTMDISGEQTDEGAILHITLVASTVDYSQQRGTPDLAGGYIAAMQDFPAITLTQSTRTAQQSSISDAQVLFYYNQFSVDSSGQLSPAQVPISCSPAVTDESGKATCLVPKEIFQDKCAKIFASYPGNQTIGPSGASMTICDRGSDAFSAMGAGLAAAVPQDQPLCIVAIIITGLLLASMFFSGRSPLSLLDITTPLLPKPKSISYSGLSYGVGYIRMSRELENIKNLANRSLSMKSDGLRKELMRRGVTSMEIDSLLALAKGDPAMGYLALRALKEGKTFAEARKLAMLRPGPGKDADLAAAGAAINAMQRGKAKDEGLDSVSLRIKAELNKKEVGLVTGNLSKRAVTIRDFVLDKTPLRILLPERIRDQIKVGVGSSAFGVKSAMAIAKQVYVTLPAKALGIQAKGEAKAAREFYLMDIRSRIEKLYKGQIAEAKANAAMYLARKLLESKGVNLQLSEKDIMRLGEIEILKKMNLKGNAAAEAVDRRIREILAKEGTMEKKMDMLLALARSEGAAFDRQGIESFLKKLASIDSSSGSYRDKFLELHDYLRTHHDNNPLGSGKFYAWVGRDSLRVSHGGQAVLDDTWTFLYLRNYFDQNEAGKKASAEDTARLLWLRIVNETWGLMPSGMKGLPEDKKRVMGQAEAYLRSLLTEEGAKALKGMKSVLELLYNPSKDFNPLFYGGELAREFGPNPAHWKTDVRGYWRVLVPDSDTLGDSKHAKTSVMEQAWSAVNRSHVSRAQSVDAIAKDMLYNRIRAMVGASHPDSYYTYNQEFRFLASSYGAYKERYAQMFGKTDAERKDSSWVSDKHVEDLIKKGISLEDLQKFVWLRTREGSYLPYTEGRELALRVSDGERIINGKLSVNVGGHWVQYNPIAVSERIRKENISLPQDLLREQQVLLSAIEQSRQAQEGLLRKKDISPELKERMQRFAESLSEWSKAGNRQDVAAHMLLRMGKEATDLSALESTGLMAIRPTRDLEYVGFRKTLQKVWQPFSRGFENATASAFLPQIKDLYDMSSNSEYFRARTAEFSGRYAASMSNPGLEPNVNPEARKNMDELMNALSRYRAVWDSTITRDPRGNSSSVGFQLNFASMYHHGPALHPNPNAVMDQFKGRDFRQMMESIRLMPLAINWTIGAPFVLMVRGAMTSWYGYPSKHDKTYHPLHPYEMTASRTLEGFRSLFDPFYSAIDFTSGTFKKVGAMMLSPLHPIGAIGKEMRIPNPLEKIAESSRISGSGELGFVGRVASTASEVMQGSTTFHTDPNYYLPYFVEKAGEREWLKGPMVEREYGGKSVQDGMIRTHEDHAWMYKNINVIWCMNTNPGVSYLDFQYQVQADPRLATHLMQGNRFKSFFSHDEYLEKQANLGIVQRETSPYELAESREDELRFYGPRSNRMWGFLNPMTFFYNNPLPLLSMATFNFLTEKGPDKLREWSAKMQRGEHTPYAELGAPQKTFMQGMPIGTVPSQLRPDTLREAEATHAETLTEKFVRRVLKPVLLNTQFVSCQSCHSPIQKGGDHCPSCASRIVPTVVARKKWAEFGPSGGTP